MWRASIFTLYPDMFPGPLGTSLSGDALGRGTWSLETHQIREHGLGRHRIHVGLALVPHGAGVLAAGFGFLERGLGAGDGLLQRGLLGGRHLGHLAGVQGAGCLINGLLRLIQFGLRLLGAGLRLLQRIGRILASERRGGTDRTGLGDGGAGLLLAGRQQYSGHDEGAERGGGVLHASTV